MKQTISHNPCNPPNQTFEGRMDHRNNMACVVCNEPAGWDHKCNEKRIVAIERGRKAHGDRTDYAPYYGSRLSVGFYWLNGCEDYHG